MTWGERVKRLVPAAVHDCQMVGSGSMSLSLQVQMQSLRNTHTIQSHTHSVQTQAFLLSSMHIAEILAHIVFGVKLGKFSLIITSLHFILTEYSALISVRFI